MHTPPIIDSLPTVSGTSTVLLTGPSQNVDYIQWIVDGVIRTVTPTPTTGAPYAFQFDTTTCANGYHVVQPISYVAGYRNFNPTTVSGCVAWFDFSDTSSLYTNSSKTTRISTNGQTIGDVVDKAGVMPDFTASTGPTFLTNQFNGLSCASFTNSTSQILESSASLPSSFLSATTGDVFIVCASPNTATTFGASSTANSNNVMLFQVQNFSPTISPNFAGDFGSSTTRNLVDATSPVTPNALFVANFRCTGSAYDFYFNGTHASSITGANNDGHYWFANLAGTPLNATIGGLIFGTTPTELAQTVMVCEILVYNTLLSSTDRAHVEAYLAEKWLPNYAINTASVVASVPTVWSTLGLSTPYTGGLVSYSSTAETPYAINVTGGVTMPKIENHYSHIKTGHLSYQGSINATDLSLFASSIDIGDVPNSPVADAVRAASPRSSLLMYVCITKQDYFNTLDWVNFADVNGLDRELGYFHVSANTPVTGLTSWGSGGFPVSWFWDCQAVRGGVQSPQYAGTMTTATASLQNGAGGSWANDNTGVTMGAASGDYIMLGYPEMFDEINFMFSTTATGSFAYTVEYPTAVDADGVPTTWAAFSSITDGTSNGTTNGKIHFDPHGLPWVTSYSQPGGAGLITWTGSVAPTLNGVMGYYVRVRTTAAGTRTPIAATIKCCDYTNQSNSWTFTTPVWNGGNLPGAGNDLDGDGYLNDTEYAAAGYPNNGGNPVRWRYQSRLPTLYGTNNMWTNFTQIDPAYWAALWAVRYINNSPQYDGLFLDDSDASSFLGVLEPSSDYSQLYGEALAAAWVLADPGPLGQRFFVLNMGPDGVTDVNSACPGAWREQQLKETNGWSHYATHLDTVARVAAQFSPSPIQMIDSFFTAGNSSTAPSDTVKLLILSAYYCLATPQTYFVPFADNFLGASLGPDNNIFPNRWIQALTVDIGQPTAASYVIATGSDPSPTAGGRTYNVYAREFDNALVLYKPLSDDGTGSVNTDTSSASNTTVTLPSGNYYQLNADSSQGTSTSGTVQLANGQGMILIKVS